jgi:hypothetical protein
MPDDDDDNNNNNKVFLGNPYGRRKAVKAQIRWLGYNGNNPKSMGIKRRKKKAEYICKGYNSVGGNG